MARDYDEIIATLRLKAAKTEFPEEAKALRAKADLLEAKYAPAESSTLFDVPGQWIPYRNPSPPRPSQTFTNQDDDTVVTSNSGQSYGAGMLREYLEWLARNQGAWNPPPEDEPTVTEDSTKVDYEYSETDTYDRHWTASEDEDYGYEEYR